MVRRMGPEHGDKVRIKSNPHKGSRGVVEEVDGNLLVVRLAESGKPISVDSELVTNFSLAARKAWEKMPRRKVGRPKGSVVCDRISVTLRIDRDLWERFKSNEKTGVISGRTQTINNWLQEKLAEVEN